MLSGTKMNRREFLKLALASAATAAVAPKAVLASLDKTPPVGNVRVCWAFKGLPKSLYTLSYWAMEPGSKEWVRVVHTEELEGDCKIGMELEGGTAFTQVQIEQHREARYIGARRVRNFIDEAERTNMVPISEAIGDDNCLGMYFDKDMGGGVEVDYTTKGKILGPQGFPTTPARVFET